MIIELEKNINNLLTTREKEIVYYMVQGLSNTEISKKLCVSIHTIKAHVSNILYKIEARNRQHACYIIGVNKLK